MKTENTEKGPLEHWSPQELAQAFARNEVAIIDVRTPQEYAFEHIHGALLAPLATFEPQNLPSQQGKRLVFHCGSGVRSRKVAEALARAGARLCQRLRAALAPCAEPSRFLHRYDHSSQTRSRAQF